MIEKNQRHGFEEAIVNMTSNTRYINEYLFYHRILCNCTVVLDSTLKAPAGVSAHYNKLTLYINPEMFNTLTLENRIVILKHEALHIIHNHFLRATPEHKSNHEVWNIATDCAINQQCNEERFSGMTPVNYKTLKEDMKLDVNIPADLDSESYFELIKKDLIDQGRTQSEGLEGLEGYDDHESWQKSEGDPELLKDIVKNIIEKSIESTLKAKGNVPGFVTELLALYSKKREVHWTKVLRNIVGNKKTSTRLTIQKRNRRFPDRVDLKGNTKDRKFNVLAVIDVSGSVCNDELQGVLGEITHICKLTSSDLDLIQIDTEARNPERITGYKKVFNRKGNGGTELKSAINKAREFKLKFNCVVVCTDGGIIESDIEAYKNLNIKIIWLITKNGTISDSMNYDRMQAFKLK